MPDALTIAAQIMKGRTENARLIMVVSDGWPNGYAEMDVALSRILSTLNGANISVIGVGTRTHKMESLFKSYCTVYELRDLTKKLSNLYFETSRIAAEA
jgi:Mg-chelatase subunit ChlD